MAKILVSGLINYETTLQVDGFPIEYSPVRYPFWGISSSVSGVGFNIAKALTILGDDVRLFSLVGKDIIGDLVMKELASDCISIKFVQPIMSQTAQSVIIYDHEGHRYINTDLKDIQSMQYPGQDYIEEGCSADLAVLCNINFSRDFIAKIKDQGTLIATDVHAIADINDEYNQDFMAAADILFMSHERLPMTPEAFIPQVIDRFRNEIIVIGLGDQGALLAVPRDRFIGRFPAVFTRPIVNTIGAGDALFSAFIHRYLVEYDPYQAVKDALVFSSYKIGESGGGSGFLEEEMLNKWVEKLFT